MEGCVTKPLADKCREKFDALIAPVRERARTLGYAIAVHGSIARDIDLIAVPWTDWAVPAAELAMAVQDAARDAIGIAFIAPHEEPELPRCRPHGRLCWSFHLGGGPYIDLSVLPRSDGIEAYRPESQVVC
jgi:hypothetical protein